MPSSIIAYINPDGFLVNTCQLPHQTILDRFVPRGQTFTLIYHYIQPLADMSNKVPDKVREVALEEYQQARTLTRDAVRSGAYLYPIRVL
jgi:hypothetical protein